MPLKRLHGVGIGRVVELDVIPRVRVVPVGDGVFDRYLPRVVHPAADRVVGVPFDGGQVDQPRAGSSVECVVDPEDVAPGIARRLPRGAAPRVLEQVVRCAEHGRVVGRVLSLLGGCVGRQFGGYLVVRYGQRDVHIAGTYLLQGCLVLRHEVVHVARPLLEQGEPCDLQRAGLPCGLGREDPELAHRALQLEGDLLGDHRVTFVSGCLLRVVAGKFGQVHLDLLPAAHREPVFGVQLGERELLEPGLGRVRGQLSLRSARRGHGLLIGHDVEIDRLRRFGVHRQVHEERGRGGQVAFHAVVSGRLPLYEGVDAERVERRFPGCGGAVGLPDGLCVHGQLHRHVASAGGRRIVVPGASGLSQSETGGYDRRREYLFQQ